MIKLFVTIDHNERKVPIDFGGDWTVGGACVYKNRNIVSAQLLDQEE